MGGADGVSAYNAKMICGARAQATDIGAHIPVRVAALTLRSGGESVAGRCAILVINSRC